MADTLRQALVSLVQSRPELQPKAERLVEVLEGVPNVHPDECLFVGSGVVNGVRYIDVIPKRRVRIWLADEPTIEEK
jgi:hypothetical protein